MVVAVHADYIDVFGLRGSTLVFVTWQNAVNEWRNRKILK